MKESGLYTLLTESNDFLEDAGALEGSYLCGSITNAVINGGYTR